MRKPAQAMGAESLWQQGAVMKAWEVSLGELAPGCCLVAEEADYFGGPCRVSGEIKKLEVDQGDSHLLLKVIARAC